jgi:hypothetical protein
MDAYTVYDAERGKIFLKRRTLDELEAPPFTHDYLSMLHYARSKPLKLGDTFSATMFTRPKTHPMHFRVREKPETVQVGAGTFNCVKIELVAGGDGRVFNKKDKIEVWVSDDEHKYPVMLKSKAKIGSINAKLIFVAKSK